MTLGRLRPSGWRGGGLIASAIGLALVVGYFYYFAYQIRSVPLGREMWRIAAWSLGPLLAAVVAIGLVMMLDRQEARQRVAGVMTARGFAPVPPVTLTQLKVTRLPLLRDHPTARLTDAFRRRVGRVSVLLFRLRPDDSGAVSTAVGFDVVERELPTFALRPATSAPAAGDRVTFARAIEFARHYRLVAADEVAVRLLFPEAAVRFFEAEPGWAVEAEGTWLLVYRTDVPLDADRVDAFLDAAARVFDVIMPTA